MRYSIPILILAVILGASFPSFGAGVVSTCNEASLNTALTGGGAVTFTCSGTITVTSTKTISINTTIDGTGQNVIISGGNSVQIFVVNSGITLGITQMTISNGSAVNGGAISSQGTVNILQSTFSNNVATGAVFSAGGAIFNNGGVLDVDSSTFTGNSAAVGGAIGAENAGFASILNSTFSANSASFSGGALDFRDTGTAGNIEFSTFFANSTFVTRSLNSASNASVSVKHSIFTESVGSSCSASGLGSITSFGVNLETDGSCKAINPSFTKVTNAQLNLQALADNGGFTQTHALGPGSVAIDATSDCTDIFSGAITVDQRGTARPQPAAGNCDVGAVEMLQTDLTASKTNDTSGALILGGSFDWDIELRLANSTPAVFAQNDVIFEDDLPGTPGSTVNYSSLSASPVGTIGGTGSISCAINTGTLSCTASGGTVSIGALNSGFDISVTVTPLATGTFANPNGTCRVDPDNELVETNDESMGTDNNGCSDSVTVTAPNLAVSKSNDTADVATLGTSFVWTLAVTNTGAEDAAFAIGEEILRDELSSNANYGSLIISRAVGISGTGAISCGIDGTPNLVCTAVGGSIIIANTTGAFNVNIQATPTSPTSPLTNPRSSATCAVDPGNEIPESNESDNTCSDSVSIQSPNLSVSKTNDTSSGFAVVPESFEWILTISNTGSAVATFQDGDIILRDSLPDGIVGYDQPGIQNDVDITGLDNIFCLIDAALLECSALGGNVTIAATTGAFDVVFSAQPMGNGTIENPENGTCRVDPDNAINESDESNNECNADSVDLFGPLGTVGTPETFNLTSSYAIPFWCGVRKDVFTMDGKDFTNLEQYETEIEVILPQKRILLIFNDPDQAPRANLIQSATITEPSNFETPGAMTPPFLSLVQVGKTIREGCNDIKAFPGTEDSDGNIETLLGNVLSGIDYFHGAITLETDTNDLRIFVTKIVRSWKCADQSSGIDCFEGKQTRDRKEISRVAVNIRRDAAHQLPFGPVASTSILEKETQLEARRLGTGRAMAFRAKYGHVDSIGVEIYSLNAKNVFSHRARGGSLTWRLNDNRGRLVANGVYFYVLTTIDESGRVMRSGMKKLVVMR